MSGVVGGFGVGCCRFGGGIGFILVLFILLVIILSSCAFI
nr:sporulation protein YjcZ [Paenibacillus faecalis]